MKSVSQQDKKRKSTFLRSSIHKNTNIQERERKKKKYATFFFFFFFLEGSASVSMEPVVEFCTTWEKREPHEGSLHFLHTIWATPEKEQQKKKKDLIEPRLAFFKRVHEGREVLRSAPTLLASCRCRR